MKPRRLLILFYVTIFLTVAYNLCFHLLTYPSLLTGSVNFHDVGDEPLLLNDANNATNDDDNDSEEGGEQAYLKWLQVQRHHSTNLTTEEEPIRLVYRAMNGLGHQLARLSSAYHLAMLYHIPNVYPTANPVCGGSIYTIYNHLIGEGPLIVNIPLHAENRSSLLLFNTSLPWGWPNLTLVNETTFHLLSMKKQQMPKRDINLINEVPGYAHAMHDVTWKPYGYHERDNFYGKIQSDYQFYHQLMLLFEHKHKSRIEHVLENIRFTDHTVFGLHIRAGNGEGGDFKLKQRGIPNIDKWIERVVNLLCGYRHQHSHYFTRKPLLIYVGTDTGSAIDKLRSWSNATCQIPFVSAEQAYPDEGKSVTWSQKYDDNDKCLKGWEDMFLDMFMFTRCNTVLGGTYSSFTQSAPLSFIMHKARRQQKEYQQQQQQQRNEEQNHNHQPQQENNSSHPHYFCDIGVDARRIDCSTTITEWLHLSPSMTWGDTKARKQTMRHEITFPNLRRPTREIVQTFSDSLLMEMGL